MLGFRVRSKAKQLFGLVMFWTVLTTVFTWLPLVRIIGRPEGYEWSILRLSGEGTQGPYWVFILLTLYAVMLLFSAYRGPRLVFYPMLILWHLAVTAVVVTAVILGGSDATIQGQGLGWTIPLWVVLIPCALFTVLALVWTVIDSRAVGASETVAWARTNSARLAASLFLLIIAVALFRAGTNYNWVTAAAIIATVLHWILLAESFQPVRAPAGDVGDVDDHTA